MATLEVSQHLQIKRDWGTFLPATKSLTCCTGCFTQSFLVVLCNLKFVKSFVFLNDNPSQSKKLPVVYVFYVKSSGFAVQPPIKSTSVVIGSDLGSYIIVPLSFFILEKIKVENKSHVKESRDAETDWGSSQERPPDPATKRVMI